MIEKFKWMTARHQQRKTVNLLLEPRVQLKLPFYFLLITVAFAGTMAWTISSAYRELFSAVASEQPAFVVAIIRDQTHDLVQVSIRLVIGYLLLVLSVAVVQSHRLVGPSVALRRQVEALKNGDYSARVALRQKDAFGPLADDLNELAALLEESAKPAAGSSSPDDTSPAA